MGEESSSIIALSISQEDGQYLVANKLGSVADLYANVVQPASGYEAWGGTSMATPHVAGVAALIWSSDSSLTNQEVRDAMAVTALDLGDTGRDIYFGYGLVQAADAITYLGGGPVNEAPTASISSPTDGATFDSGAAISFVGSASDYEDGNISGDLVWTSSIDGQINTGASFSAVLSDGNHTITASVEDSGGKTASDSVSITVGTVQEPDIMGVTAVDMWYAPSGRKNYVYTQVTVEADGQPVVGASVSISMVLPSGGTATGTATTGSDGSVTFSIKTFETGTFASTVTNVMLDPYTWDGVQASATLQIP
jgi:hypothetical protein